MRSGSLVIFVATVLYLLPPPTRPPQHYSILIYTPSAAIPLMRAVTNLEVTLAIFAAPARCLRAGSLEVISNQSILVCRRNI